MYWRCGAPSEFARDHDEEPVNTLPIEYRAEPVVYDYVLRQAKRLVPHAIDEGSDGFTLTISQSVIAADDGLEGLMLTLSVMPEISAMIAGSYDIMDGPLLSQFESVDIGVIRDPEAANGYADTHAALLMLTQILDPREGK